MRYLSLFSGIEAASIAWRPLGWECVAVSEIEPFPCEVLKQRHGAVPNLGDVTKISEEDIKQLGRIDLVVFGSPCQDLSVAGKRKGLEGERSGLFHVAINIVKWAKEHGGCRFALWENVPGVFSSNKGRDFAAVVGRMAGCRDVPVPPKGWGSEGCAIGEEGILEWATLDAQWFGVAQERRRVFALADFGDWFLRPPILLEPESMRGDSPPPREVRENPTCLGFHSNAQAAQMKFNSVSSPLTCSQYAAVLHGDILRRNTPRECERLQGFPDDYTLVHVRGKPAADGPRYKALGNSMAVPVMRWIGTQIQNAVTNIDHLF